MNKKTIIIVLVLILAALAVGFFVYKNYKTSHQAVTNAPPVVNQPVVYQMSGKITAVSSDSIMVEGQVGPVDKIVEFIVGPQTVINKSQITITANQLKSGKQFQPKTVVVTAKFSDLTLNEQIIRIVSKENLINTKKVTATEINLASYDFPTTSTAK